MREVEKGRIPHAELLQTLHYNEFTGVFIWLKTNSNKRGTGARAGSVEAKNFGKKYIFIRLNNRVYRGHTLAHFYMTGKWPSEGIRSPHRNGEGTDNRWENIKDAYERGVGHACGGAYVGGGSYANG